MIDEAVKDAQSVTPDWTPIQDVIDGVRFQEVKNVLTRNGGVMTEVFRDEWDIGAPEVKHIIHVTMQPGVVNAWHFHEIQTDRIFVVRGRLQAALYDGREGFKTHGRVNVFQLSLLRPGLLVIPPGVWHGFKNVANEPAAFINFFDHPYRYENPDEWRLPPDSSKIPYAF